MNRWYFPHMSTLAPYSVTKGAVRHGMRATANVEGHTYEHLDDNTICLESCNQRGHTLPGPNIHHGLGTDQHLDGLKALAFLYGMN